MTIALALIGAFGVLRAVVPSIWLVVLLTFPVGIGMGLGNALAPLAVRETRARPPGDGHRRLHDGDPDRLDRWPPRSPCRSPPCSAAGAVR